ncbi:MAG: CBS domain-containing protein [Bacteroidota bacterium]
MQAIDLITEEMLTLKTSDTGNAALSFMDDLKVSHLPIINEMELLGLVSESDIYEANAFEESIGGINLKNKNICITHDQHIFDIIAIMHQHQLSLLPVVDDKNNYLGSITLTKCLDAFALLTSADQKGGVIILEINQNDYNLTEISNIVESNDLKILSLFFTSHSDSTKIEVTLKLNRNELGAVLQTFNRYNYQITASYASEEDTDYLKERYDSLMNYLNI